MSQMARMRAPSGMSLPRQPVGEALAVVALVHVATASSVSGGEAHRLEQARGRAQRLLRGGLVPVVLARS